MNHTDVLFPLFTFLHICHKTFELCQSSVCKNILTSEEGKRNDAVVQKRDFGSAQYSS